MKRPLPISVAMISGTLVCLSLAGCASDSAKIAYQPVNTPVAVSCVPPNAPAKPVVPTPHDLAKPDGPTRHVQLGAAYLALYAWSLQIEPVIDACR